jgi:hypothetical protein
MGYQLDWIWYKGDELTLVEDSWTGLGQVNPGNNASFCSDHAPLAAKFKVAAIDS